MTKITSASKKMLSLLLAVLMLCSGMTVLASAEETTVEVEKITLNSDNCKLIINDKGKEIRVNKASTKTKGSDSLYEIQFSAVRKDATTGEEATYDKDGNWIFKLPMDSSNVTYIVSGKITVEGKEYPATNEYSVIIKNSQDAPVAPVPLKITSTTIELKTIVGGEYKIGDGAWQDSAKFTGLLPETKYVVSQRYKETGTAYASADASVTVTTLKAADADAAPQPVLVDKTQTSITVAVVKDGKELSGYEFSRDGGKTWQKSGLFTGLTANTVYSFIAVKSYNSAEQDPNKVSEALKVVTNAKENYVASLDKCGFKITSQPHSDAIYAGDTVGFTANGDGRSNLNELQYGDTRFVPVSYKATQGVTEETALSSTYSGTVTTTGKATVKVTVYFEKQKYVGGNENGGWSKVGVESRSFTFEVKDAYNAAKHFFQQVLNFLLDTLPSIINKALTAGVITKIIDFITSLGKK